MNKKLSMVLSPEEAYEDQRFEQVVKDRIGADSYYRIAKRSIDARKKAVRVNVQLDVFDRTPPELLHFKKNYAHVSAAPRVIIVGAGPAGLFAALRLIELGVKPIVLERGKDVRARRRDLSAISKQHVVNPESNYCFGEGGAGTYSDGKLYTRSKKRGDILRILEILVAHGAKEDILYEAHPHIGTNKLPQIVTALRESILEAGGKVVFGAKVTDFIMTGSEIKGVVLESGEKMAAEGVILCTGHSARDIFQLLKAKKITIEAKPFALGVRVEHPQEIIDGIQYHCNGSGRGNFLPPSSYALVHQTHLRGKKRGVFSFCMCPGGFIVPAATAPGEIVVNGMSPSRRNSRYANSGIVAAVELEDLNAYAEYEELAAVVFQGEVERKACSMAGGTQQAPAQKLVDFVQGVHSSYLNRTSYQPGLQSTQMTEVLPHFIAVRLKAAFQVFGKKMKGYFTNEAQIVGVESRTSSPVRIPRNPETLEHVTVRRLYPCGEGAGYAGGIVSAAMDGERCALAFARKYQNKKIKA
ncbi:MAG: FAD-dependent oxidoreductase [Bacteroidota bacterium]